MGLIDFHAHLAPTKEARERLLTTMKKHGIERSVVVAGGLISPQVLSRHIRYGGINGVEVPNLDILELSLETGGKLLPFYFANPMKPADEYRDQGINFFGLKLGPAVHGIPLMDSRNMAYIELASRFRHSIYLHCLPRNAFDIETLTNIASMYPEANFVLGHCGIGNCDFMAIDSIRDIPNIYVETSGGFSSVVKYAVDQLGIGRLLFGSEYPLQDPSIEIFKIQQLDLPSHVFVQNAIRLLDFGDINER